MHSRRLTALSLGLALVASACTGAAEPEPTATTVTPMTTVPPTTTTTTEPEPTTTTTTTTTIPSPQPLPIEPPEGYELVWSDEFDGDEINPDNWTHEIGGWGWGNGEAQYYTDRPENSRIQNGLLVIELRQEKFENSYYTSARLVTQEKQYWQYGYIEARVKVPGGIGTWPAFWTLGEAFVRNPDDPFDSNWPHIGEIDIMEVLGREPDLVMGTIHGPGYSGAGSIGTWFRQEHTIADDWHTYAIEWDYDGIRWFYDGIEYAYKERTVVGENREWVFDAPHFVILNLALGGNFGGTIAIDLEFPRQMYVDHVRVYQKAEDAG